MHMRHTVICGLPGSAVYFHIIVNGKIFEKKYIANKMCVLIFSTTFVWNISHSEKNWERYDQKCVLVFMYSTRYSCQNLMKLEPSRHPSASQVRFYLCVYDPATVSCGPGHEFSGQFCHIGADIVS